MGESPAIPSVSGGITENARKRKTIDCASGYIQRKMIITV
jgi:hypothetical protein